MKFTRGLLSAVLAICLLVLSGFVATSASAHTYAVEANCDALDVTLTRYDDSGPNHVKVIIDGVTVADENFGTSYDETFGAPDKSKSYDYVVTVTAHDGAQYSFTESDKSKACPQPGAGHIPVDVCHATNSDSNPYVFITVDANSTRFQGHLAHRNTPNKTWKSDTVFNGVLYPAGSKKPDFIADYTDKNGKRVVLDGSITEAFCKGAGVPPTSPSGDLQVECVDNAGQVSTANLNQGTATTIEWRLVKGTAANHTTVLASGTGNGNLTAGNLAEGTMVWLQYRTSADGNWVDEGSFRTIGNCTGSGVPTLDKSSPNDGATVPLGSTIHYKVVVGNTGNAPITSRPVVDTLPDGVTYVTGSSTSVTTGGGTASAAPTTGTSGGHNTLTWTVTLPPSATATFEFDVTVNANNPRAAELKNTAAFENLTDFTVHTVEIPASNPTLDKSSPNDGATVPLGSTIHYKVVVGNTGNAPITSRPVVDTLPDGVTYVTGSSTSVTTGGGTASAAPTTGTSGGHNTLTWTVTLPPSATATFEFDVTVNANNPRAAELKNTAAFENLTDFTVHTVEIPASNPTLDKSSPNDGATVPLGSTIHYKVVVGNTGNAPITSRPVVDTLPDGVTYVTGSSTSVTTGGGTASAAPTTGTSGGHNTLTWTVTLPPSATATFEFDVTVNANNPRAAELKNTAAFENLTDFTVHTVGIPNPTLDKFANPTTTEASPALVAPGTRIDYSVKVGNTGNFPITNAPVVDTLPNNVTLVASTISDAGALSSDGRTITWSVTLTPGASKTFTYAVTVDQATPQGAVLVNTAKFQNLTDTTTHVVPTGALSLVKGVSPVAGNGVVVEFGDTLTYTLTAAATGNLDQPNVVVTDYVPGSDPARPGSGSTTYVTGSAACVGAGTCTVTGPDANGLITWNLGTMAAGTSRQVTFQVTIDDVTGEAGATVAVDVLNAGAVKSDRTPVTSSNEVTTPVTKVLGVKTPNEEQPGAGPVTQPGTLPHTGAGLPLGATVGGSLVLVAMGLLLTGAGRRPRTAVR